MIYHLRLICECISANHLASRPHISRVSEGSILKLRIKLTGAVQDFREEAGEADVGLLCTSYAIKTI